MLHLYVDVKDIKQEIFFKVVFLKSSFSLSGTYKKVKFL